MELGLFFIHVSKLPGAHTLHEIGRIISLSKDIVNVVRCRIYPVGYSAGYVKGLLIVLRVGALLGNVTILSHHLSPFEKANVFKN